MPRSSDHLLKSAIRLVRQSTTVPNTSNTRAFTAEISDMLSSSLLLLFALIPISFRRLARTRNPYSDCGYGFRVRAMARHGITMERVSSRARSIEMEFLKLAVLALDVTHRAGDRAHHDGLGLDDILAEFHARQQRARGDAGRGEQAVAPRHVLDAVNHLGIPDAHLVRACAVLIGIENEPALHLATDTAQRHRRQHAFG